MATGAAAHKILKAVPPVPSAQYSLTLRVEIDHRPGMLGKVASAIGDAGGTIGAVDLVQVAGAHTIRDITVATADASDWPRLSEAVDAIPGARVLDATDRTFLLHVGGKIELRNKSPIRTREDLSMAYTPGVARVCLAIKDDPDKAFQYTIKRNTVAVVSDGTAVLGLGDIGPRAAMPVMEGKAMLFKEFAGIDACPICLDTRDPDEIVDTVKAIAPAFGGVNLEDISAPRCFDVEERLKAELDIPVFHDDQHGTAVVVMAALLNALMLTGQRLEDIRIVISGVGAAGIAVARILLEAGARHITGCDSRGALHVERDDYVDGSMHAVKRWLASVTNEERRSGPAAEVLEGADLFIGVSGARVVDGPALARMNPDPIVFAMANPNPEVLPEEAAPYARIMATGRSDYPNQINNVLCFPGIFRGALDVRATAITEQMKMAAARAIAQIVSPEELREDYIIPSVFNRDVVGAVASAVAEEARESGTAAAGAEVGFAHTEEFGVIPGR
jgi:malate dehydrogenase (oxaloacetate-decarboxylating)